MITTNVLAAAEPWTFWMAPPLLVLNALALVLVVVGYYRKVVVPRYEWQHHQEQLRYESELRQHRPATPLRGRGAAPELGWREAA